MTTEAIWDNCGRFVKTKKNKYTLNDTVGIAYQVLDNSEPSMLEDNQERQNISDLIITPYKKKPKFVAHGMLELNH